MIFIEDTSQTLPAIVNNDYAGFFQQLHIAFLGSQAWTNLLTTFRREMQMQVAPGDIEALKKYLHEQRDLCKKNFEGKGCAYLWGKCFILKENRFDEVKFVKLLETVSDGTIDRKEMDEFFTFYCLTHEIDTLLAQVFEYEKRQNGRIVFNFSNNGEMHFGEKPKESTDATQDAEEPLGTKIFDTRLFNNNQRLNKLRATIASAIDIGDFSSLFPDRQETRINPQVKKDWYYIIKPIEEANVAKRFSVTQFLDEMIDWFPFLFDFGSVEEMATYKRLFSKSISEEKSLWRHGKKKEIIPLKEMWAKSKDLQGLDSAAKERIWEIAHEGLYKKLVALKQEIERENSYRQRHA